VTTRKQPLATLLTLDQEGRRLWLRGWMERLGLENANQAAPILLLSRQTVERMLYETSAARRPVSDQTMKIAYLVEKIGLQRST